jgi:hypothetical protein
MSLAEIDKNQASPIKNEKDELSQDLHLIRKINNKYKNITTSIKTLPDLKNDG